jgi:DNA-binding PadR family transcriptional regulator
VPRDGLAALGRFSEPALFILISLADGPKHGYAMVDDIFALIGARLGPGTLYGAIARLERLGLIAALPASDRRRPYELTQAGATTLRTELDQLTRLAAAGAHRLRAHGVGARA